MSAKILEVKNSLEKTLRDPKQPWAAYFDQLEKKLNVSRLYIFIGLVSTVCLYLVYGFGAGLVSNTIGFLYPAYKSIKAIETKEKDDDTKWLTYWTVFAFFSLIEFFSDKLVGWFPLYWLGKCLTMVWLMVPGELNGSLILYKKYLRPYFLQHHGKIDEVLESVKKTATNVGETIRKKD